jgi:hypothetical protein
LLSSHCRGAAIGKSAGSHSLRGCSCQSVRPSLLRRGGRISGDPLANAKPRTFLAAAFLTRLSKLRAPSRAGGIASAAIIICQGFVAAVATTRAIKTLRGLLVAVVALAIRPLAIPAPRENFLSPSNFLRADRREDGRHPCGNLHRAAWMAALSPNFFSRSVRRARIVAILGSLCDPAVPRRRDLARTIAAPVRALLAAAILARAKIRAVHGPDDRRGDGRPG